jgi:hypothetical protein
MDTPPSGSSNYSKLSINEIVGDYEKMIVEFQDGTTQELSMATLVGVTEFKFDKPAIAIQFVGPAAVLSKESPVSIEPNTDAAVEYFNDITPWKLDN